MDSTAADTLDRIREGATYVVAVAHQRLAEAQEALGAGDFVLALTRVQEAMPRLQTLNTAQVQMSGWDDLEFIRARDLTVGHTVYAWDVVEEVDSRPHPSRKDEIVVVAKGKLGDIKQWPGDTELIIFISQE